MGNNLVKGAPLPESLGHCADMLHEVRELRLEMQRQTDAVKDRETEISEHIIRNLSKKEERGAVGLRYVAKVKTDPVPRIGDWDKFTAFVAASKRFDLLQKRVGEKAVEDMWDNGETVPGIEKINVPKLSLTKV